MLNATLQQLRLFEAVARNGSFTKAAQEIHRSQPAVSIQVKRLEEQIDVDLFEQVGKKIYLTSAGRELYSVCADVFQRLRQFEEAMDELRGEVTGPLNIGVVTTAKYFLPNYLGEFLRKYPDVIPRMTVTNRKNLIYRMENNMDDLYVLGEKPEHLSLKTYPFFSDNLVLVASPDHPLVGKKISPRDLLTARLLYREPESDIRMTLEPFFAKRDIAVEPYMELGSGEAVKQACMAGMGIGMISESSAHLELESRKLAVLDVEGLPIYRTWNLVHLKGKKLPQAAQKFLDMLVGKQFIPSE